MSVVKNCVEVWSRLFDHKPFLQSELNSFVHEFEESRNDREIVNLLDTLNIECEINNQFDTISSFVGTSLTSLNEKVDGCVKQTDDLLKGVKVEKEKIILENRRKQRAASWEAYNESMEPKYIKFDDEIKAELEQVKRIYESQNRNE